TVISESFLGKAGVELWALVNPLNDPMTVLVIAILLGAIHMLFGQGVHMYMGARDGGFKGFIDAALDVVPWWTVFAGIGLMVATGSAALIWGGVIFLIATQGRHKEGLLGKLWGGIASLYDITSWLGDILSYARLMALMLATTVIASVVNILGTLPGSIIAFIPIFLIGHVFNLGINVIGTYVHAARLQYLEFFSKFYKGGGTAFTPLQYDTKYCDVVPETKEA
ncbi:MAG: V-type ATP synthase subunit I, partial [Oscillospiraceae bacterium]|nr:V-type ATP synthase subunit I [Oscillospiraceae bacterium]